MPQENLAEFFARVVRDVFIGIAAGQQESVGRLNNAPFHCRIVGCANYQHPARPQHPPHFREQDLIVGNMFNDLRADHAIEAGILERQRECRPAHQRYSVAAQKPQLAEIEFHAHGIVEALNDQARAAAGIEDSAGAARPRNRDVMAASLPVALDGNDAVVGTSS